MKTDLVMLTLELEIS